MTYTINGLVGRHEEADTAFASGDYATAFLHLRPLAEQGDARAQFGLGVIYANGKGVPQDHTKAVEWYRKAAEQGYPPGQYILGGMYAEGRGALQDCVKAHMWLTLAAAQEWKGAQDSREARDNAACDMTPEQIGEAQRLAREWKPKK